MYNQQGDVIISAVSSIPSGAKKVSRKNGRLIVAEGEATGHAHAILDNACEMFEKDGVLYLRSEKDVPIVHEEHVTNVVHAGISEIRIVREYDHFSEEAREVKD